MSDFKLEPGQPVPSGFTYRLGDSGEVFVLKSDFLTILDAITQHGSRETMLLIKQRDTLKSLCHETEVKFVSHEVELEEVGRLNRLLKTTEELLSENVSFRNELMDAAVQAEAEIKTTVIYLERLFAVLHAGSKGLPYPHEVIEAPKKPGIIKRFLGMFAE